jgi:hypothetical protein
MARRTGRQADSNTSTNQNAEAPAEAATQEDAVTTATTEAPVETPTENDQPAEQPTDAPAEGDAPSEKKEEAPVDLTAFEAAVEAAADEADETTGTVPEADIAKVTEAYRALDGLKAKNKAKALVNDKLSDAMNSGKLERARSYFNIGEQALVAAAGGTKREATPTDPTEAFVQRVASLSLAYGLAVSNQPEGVAADAMDRANSLTESNREAASAYAAWLSQSEEDRGDEPEAPAFVKAAVKLAQGKPARAGSARSGGGSTFDGPRRDIGKHILEVFADKPVGTFLKVAEIRSTDTSEYKAGEASAGAISARLFPEGDGTKSSMNKFGIKPDTQDGRKGAIKVAEADSSDSE